MSETNRELEIREIAGFNIFWDSNAKIEARQSNVRICELPVGEDEVEGIADIHFVFNLEVERSPNATVPLSEDEERIVLGALDQALLNGLEASTCLSGTTEEQSGEGARARRSLRLGSSGLKYQQANVLSRRLEIATLSTVGRDTYKGSCESSSVTAECRQYDGSIAVGYTGQGENDSLLEAGSTALKALSKEMEEGTTLVEAMNEALRVYQSNNAMEFSNITRIAYEGTTFYDLSAGSDTTITGVQRGFADTSNGGGGLSTMGKVFVPILCILFVVALGAAYLSYQVRRGVRRSRKSVMSGEVRDGLYLHDEDEAESDNRPPYYDSGKSDEGSRNDSTGSSGSSYNDEGSVDRAMSYGSAEASHGSQPRYNLSPENHNIYPSLMDTATTISGAPPIPEMTYDAANPIGLATPEKKCNPMDACNLNGVALPTWNGTVENKADDRQLSPLTQESGWGRMFGSSPPPPEPTKETSPSKSTEKIDVLDDDDENQTDYMMPNDSFEDEPAHVQLEKVQEVKHSPFRFGNRREVVDSNGNVRGELAL